MNEQGAEFFLSLRNQLASERQGNWVRAQAIDILKNTEYVLRQQLAAAQEREQALVAARAAGPRSDGWWSSYGPGTGYRIDARLNGSAPSETKPTPPTSRTSSSNGAGPGRRWSGPRRAHVGGDAQWLAFARWQHVLSLFGRG